MRVTKTSSWMKMEKKDAIRVKNPASRKQLRGKGDTGRQRKKELAVQPTTKRRYFTHEPSPPPSKKTKTIKQSGADESDVSAEYAEPNEFATVVVSNASLREEYEPRRRNSRLLHELRLMENEEYTVGTW
ncbi:hypothetical protein PC129_g22310 [Phytophthora cactorum]|uniref:Uncharacterized protein n=1 Tax=Phytophthora cactorum TaxID=29920 RepID=A0A8T1H3A9_9STRA|nr:hypothetical protein PC121_g23428 [Phytophthora cactorum]KAG3054648.1 hypothetical protein PC122_g21957 [Phytophthora cactorum]KAG3205013.1 hypothetical protein PC129_g22310 [Phytophthora cactorum]